MTRLTTVADAEAAAARAAEVIARHLTDARERRGIAHLSLAGGSTPRRAYELLAPLLDWDGVHLWFGDERCVGPQDPESNYRMVAESLLARADVPVDQVHRVLGEEGPDDAADAYAAELRAHVAPDAQGMPVLDVAHLGLGEDGHTASLFPDHPALDVEDAPCVAVRDSPKPPPERVSLTLPVLRAARSTILLTAGAGKAQAVAAVLAGPDRHVPASLLASNRFEVIVDDAAAPPR
jgi:6-phosphogluconolactonase